jgi:hypothetical protein
VLLSLSLFIAPCCVTLRSYRVCVLLLLWFFACGFCRCDALAISVFPFSLTRTSGTVCSISLHFFLCSSCQICYDQTRFCFCFCLFVFLLWIGWCVFAIWRYYCFFLFRSFFSTKKKCFFCHLDLAFCSGNIELFTGHC